MKRIFTLTAAAALTAALTLPAYAQNRTTTAPSSGAQNQAPQYRVPPRPAWRPARRGPMQRGRRDMGAEAGLAGSMPQGQWWNRPAVAQRLELTAAEQKRMDGIYASDSARIIDLNATVQKDQLALRMALEAQPLNPGQADNQFNQLVDARANAQKARGRMALDLANQLTPDQLAKLRTGMGERGGRFGGR